MRKSIAAVIVLLIASQLYSQTIIQGKLRDNKGKPIPGASVSIKDSYDGTVADSLGSYKFSTTEKGDRSLIATNIGYKSFEQKITIGSIKKNDGQCGRHSLNYMKSSPRLYTGELNH